MVRVLSCLNEIEERKLHLQLGHRSMIHFCVEALGYARSSAGRRITAARCMKRFAEIREMLERNDANVVTIARVSGILTPENKDEVLGCIRGRTQEEVEALVASYRPREVVRDSVREVFVPRRVATGALPVLTAKRPAAESPPPQAVAGGAPQAPASPQSHNETEYKDSGPKKEGVVAVSGEASAPACEEFESRVVVKFSASKEFMAKLRRFRSLAWHRLPANASMEQIIGLLLDDSLKRNDPAQREARRARRRERPQAAQEGARSAVAVSARAGNVRQIPAPVRDAVFVRDGGRCTYVSRTGRTCGSRDGVQIDHVVPVARGGSAAPDNLRLLCGFHNRLEAERMLGKFR